MYHHDYTVEPHRKIHRMRAEQEKRFYSAVDWQTLERFNIIFCTVSRFREGKWRSNVWAMQIAGILSPNHLLDWNFIAFFSSISYRFTEMFGWRSKFVELGALLFFREVTFARFTRSHTSKNFEPTHLVIYIFGFNLKRKKKWFEQWVSTLFFSL